MLIVSCSNCLSKFKVQPPEGEPRFIKCAACAHVFVVSPGMVSLPVRSPDGKTAEFLPELSYLETPPVKEGEEGFTAIGTATAPVDEGEEGKRKGRQAVVVVASRDEILPLAKFQTTFGRRNADVTIDDPDISRQHAVIERYDEKFLIKDLESTNGTYLNGQRITIDFLEDGDIIRMGKTVMRFQVR